MTDILVKLFVKDYKDVEKVSVRTAYGVLARSPYISSLETTWQDTSFLASAM